MGAAPFEQYADGADVATAFRTACADAVYEHGAGGYTGSLVEKHDYVVITRQPMDLAAATRLARDLITRRDPRVDDKWGPAGAIPIRSRTDEPSARRGQTRPDGWLFFGVASS